MNKQILRLAIPNIISNLSVPLLSSVDTALMGHLDAVYYLGALSVGSIIFNFIYWGFGFLRMGTTGLTAQALGNQDQDEVARTLARTLLFAFVAGIVLITLQDLIAAVSFRLIDATPEVERYARQYFYIRIYAAPATLALYAFHGWFLGMQNAKYPLILTVFVNVVNVAMNVLFVRRLHMTSDGVAYGTVIAQYSGLVLAFWLFRRKYAPFTVRGRRSGVFERHALKRIFRVNSDIFLRTLGLIFTLSYFTAKSAEAGDEILAANTILLQFITILSYGVDGFAFASESLVGKYLGAGDAQNLRKTVHASFRWGLGLGALVAGAYGLAGEQFLRIFTDNDAVLLLCKSYLVWVVASSLINSVCFIWDGVFLGATATAPMRNSMLFCTFFVFLPTYFLFRPALGNHALWLALTLFMLMRGVTLTWYAGEHIFGRLQAA
ncbi:MAG: MATE family efflux transporter [Calditrichaeota bacterium]|nr:MAG: MATE family efflux transporter [Calditrichota bacterium]